jgi:hypothetical protein
MPNRRGALCRRKPISSGTCFPPSPRVTTVCCAHGFALISKCTNCVGVALRAFRCLNLELNYEQFRKWSVRSIIGRFL